VKEGRIARRREKVNDSYYVSLADLLIGLIFIFIILLVASALSYQAAEQRAERLQIELDERADLRLKLLEDLKADMAREKIEVHIDRENGVLRLPEHALFASGEATLGDEGKRAVRELGKAMTARLRCYGSERGRTNCPEGTAPIFEAVYVEGHTDNRNIKSQRFPSNWELSSARAITTYRALLDGAPALREIRNVQNTATLLGVSAYADQRAVGDNSTEAGRRDNRRIDLRFLLAPTGAR
jgi:chemotaxis protein MotB